MSLRGAGHDRYFAFEIAHRLLLFRWRTERPTHYARLLSLRQFDNYRTTVPNRSSERGERGSDFPQAKLELTPSCCIFDLISRLGDFSMSSSLSPIFRLALAVFIPWRGLTDSTGARDGTRADGVLDRGRRRLLFFLAFCLAAPSSYRVDRGRHPGVVAIRWGGAASTILATHARARGAMRRFQIAVSFFVSATRPS